MIPLVKVLMPDKAILMPALEAVLYSGMVAEGESVYRFEREFARHFGLTTVVCMSSGTASLHAALALAGVRPGDEVVSTPMTAEPTNMAILYAGAVPVWADVEADTGTLDPRSVQETITERTAAIMVVHYAGYPARMDELSRIAASRGIPLIEDCAHALGAEYGGKPVGLQGDFSIFSFQAIKHMTTVDGGALVLKDPSQLDEAKRFRWFGLAKGVARTNVDIKAIGYKYNMNNVTAAIGLAQLDAIDPIIARHKANGAYYDREFAGMGGFKPARFEAAASPSYWIYSLLCDDSEDACRSLAEIGVEASKLHRPNNLHSIFAGSSRELPGLDRFYRRLLHIPCGWWVDDETREKIVERLRRG
jgi:dTDP-4-amino-4,6-dideoxygalactose transaminase